MSTTKRHSSSQTLPMKPKVETKQVQHVIPPQITRNDSEGGGTETRTIYQHITSTIGVKSGLRVGGLMKSWAEVSNINYFSSLPIDMAKRAPSLMRRSTSIDEPDYPEMMDFPTLLRLETEKKILQEEFPENVTSLMNEDQYWGCFFVFPELYNDIYSPVIKVRDEQDVNRPVNGVLTQELVSVCLSYLKRTPILGDLVLIKLDLASKELKNIEVLQHYKYLVYLDLSSNLLSDISVVSKLPYLQYLSVNYNRLTDVLDYDPPQWFLSEVHYKYNSVKLIDDLTQFWSITILDLSHNNIKAVNGLQNLRYLRRLDLSFNHIQKIENLNHLRLIWLDLSYNNISSYELDSASGLWTLLHLEYLNVNENNLTSMRMFSDMYRLRELHARNNRFPSLLELAVHTRQLRRLVVLDLRANPICAVPGYKEVLLHTYPALLNLDSETVDPVEHRTAKMDFNPLVEVFASRRLLRLLYMQQLRRSRVPCEVPPADTTDVPLVVLVGHEAAGKGTLARRLATEYSNHIELGRLHTTATYHYEDHYIEVSRQKFDDMLVAGEFLTYNESNGESYGLSLEQSMVNPGKMRLVSMGLVPALMLLQRGRRAILILVTCDRAKMTVKQIIRKKEREVLQRQHTMCSPVEKSTLQVLLSGRIIITGILNEIMLNLPEEKSRSEFQLDPDCSLMMYSTSRPAAVDVDTHPSSAASSHNMEAYQTTDGQETSIYSLYKSSQGMQDADNSDVGQTSYQEPKRSTADVARPQYDDSDKDKKSFDFSRYTSTTWKAPESSKSSKSVTFISPEPDHEPTVSPTGMIVDPPSTGDQKSKILTSISTKLPWPAKLRPTASNVTLDEDLWLHFLVDAGLLQESEAGIDENKTPLLSEICRLETAKIDDMTSLMDYYLKVSYDFQSTTNVRDVYEDVHRNSAGTFWDTINTDDPNEAYKKLKRIAKDIFDFQKKLKPMFDIDFPNLEHYPTVQARLKTIRDQIAPNVLFY